VPSSTPRLRFAPAPTGYLHIGGARTALFNWLYARQQGGELVLRIEDTDAERSKSELVDAIYESLEWLGIDWDGEPVHQSDRSDLYREAVEKLLASGQAYRCDCSQDEVQARAKARGGAPGYDGHCRDRDVQPGEGVVVRFRTPDEGVTAFDDLIRGEVVFENENLEDFVIVRSNGVTTFFVANAVDDADLGITHVIRGEDLINVTPKVLLLREALGVTERPVFAHLPLIVNEQRKKLSKRRDDVAVGDYRERGYLPEAMANYLATLGWGPPDGVEIRPMSEIVELFRIDEVTKASAFFDLKKLDHFNAEYVRALDLDDFIARSQPFLDAAELSPVAHDAFLALAPLVQERVKHLDEVPGYVAWFDTDPVLYDEDAWAKKVAKDADAAAVLDDALAAFADCEWEHDALRAVVDDIAARHERKTGKIVGPFYVALTGRAVGPPLYEAMVVLGREQTLKRLRAARERL
jgi:glutamyl-tRNA synthetase